MLSIVQLEDVPGAPSFKLDLPGPLRIGDPVTFPKIRLRRVTKEARHEVLEFEGKFRVKAVGLDASQAPPRQLLTVEGDSVVPLGWKAVKRPSGGRKKLSPARSPKTSI